ncbi:hypothetical protein [Georgenia deserti]|uniref:Uncharacterized protein n=1 Tax=Georgenia deserti TaxID=2093781 RepID=A0ABW4L3E7_9MICO
MPTTADPSGFDEPTPIRTPQDVFRRWRDLMGPLGFTRRHLWFQFVTPDGLLAPPLSRVEDIPEDLDPEAADGLMQILELTLPTVGADSTVALLLSRPGPARMTRSDLGWARGLIDAAARTGVALQPIHLATDEAIRVFAADDLLPA